MTVHLFLTRLVVAASVALLVGRAAIGADPAIDPRPSITQLPPGSVERFAPLLGEGPDARWDGCWLVGASNDARRILLELRCAVDGDPVRVTVGAAGPDYAIAVDGAPDHAAGLRAATRRHVEALLARPDPGELAWLLAAWVLLVAFVTAWALGGFGVLAKEARDPLVLAPLALALVTRTLLTTCANEEIRLHFQTGALSDVLGDKHSLVSPLLRLLAIAITRTPVEGQLALDLALGALVTIPLFVFVVRRTGDRRAALLAALVVAVHPALARSSASDAHYPLMLASWAIGLATLSHDRLEPRGAFAGVAWLAIAAGCRFDGALVLIASVPLLGVDACRRVLTHRRALALGLALVVLVEVGQLVLKLPLWRSDLAALSRRELHVSSALLEPIVSPHAGGAVLGVLSVAAIALGLASSRRRLVFALASAWLFVVLVTLAWTGPLVPLVAHRVSPEAFVLAIAAAVGLSAALERVPDAYRSGVTGVVAVLVALGVLVTTRDVREREHAFQTEYRLALRAARTLPRGCALAFFGCDDDTALCNPELLARDRPVLDCRLDDCAAPAACVAYLRTGACSTTRLGACAALEARWTLVPVEEREVDLLEAYGGDGLPTHTRVGLYRVAPRGAEPARRLGASSGTLGP